MKQLFKKLMSAIKKKDEQGSSGNGVTVLLRCGEREIEGNEYDTLAMYNQRIQSTEFGILLFHQMLDKYGKLQHVYGRTDGIEYAYNFGTETNLTSFVNECRRYLKLD